MSAQDQPPKQAKQPGHPNLNRGGFKPGQSGNPGGRPKGRSLLAEIRDCFDKTELMGKALPGGKTAKQAMAEAICWHVIRGQSGYLRVLFEHLYGRPAIRMEHKVSGDDGSELPESVVNAMLEAGLKAAEAEGGER